MRIGEMASELGLAPETLRYYERLGLVPAPARGDGRYREYSAEDAERLRLLAGLRALDVPRATAAKLATMCAAGRCDEVSDELRVVIPTERARLRERIRDLRQLDVKLAALELHLDAGHQPRGLIQVERRMDDC